MAHSQKLTVLEIEGLEEYYSHIITPYESALFTLTESDDTKTVRVSVKHWLEKRVRVTATDRSMVALDDRFVLALTIASQPLSPPSSHKGVRQHPLENLIKNEVMSNEETDRWTEIIKLFMSIGIPNEESTDLAYVIVDSYDDARMFFDLAVRDFFLG